MSTSKKMGRPPIDRPKVPNALSVRGTQEWRDWLAEIAETLRVTPTQLIDMGLAEIAAKHKLKPPPRRI